MGQLDSPGALSAGKDTRYFLDRTLSGPQGWSGRCGEENRLISGLTFSRL